METVQYRVNCDDSRLAKCLSVSAKYTKTHHRSIHDRFLMSLCWVKSRPWQQDEERGLTGARGTYTVTLGNVRVLIPGSTYLVHSGKCSGQIQSEVRSYCWSMVLLLLTEKNPNPLTLPACRRRKEEMYSDKLISL